MQGGGVMLVYDITNQKSFDSITSSKWHRVRNSVKLLINSLCISTSWLHHKGYWLVTR